ncbi:unnamed protein product, partial [Nesidiocoris tenuis]
MEMVAIGLPQVRKVLLNEASHKSTTSIRPIGSSIRTSVNRSVQADGQTTNVSNSGGDVLGQGTTDFHLPTNNPRPSGTFGLFSSR